MNTCRFCREPLTKTFVDLGMSPVANAMVPREATNSVETFYPLEVFICDKCLLVQIPNTVRRETIFNDTYTYFSSYSNFWLNHAKDYTDMIVKRLKLNSKSFVIELASNDGYLLKNLVKVGIPVLGIDPCANVALAAQAVKVPTMVEFFGVDLANKLRSQGKIADLVIANNVLAHVPDINDFVAGIARVLKKSGTVTAEFPHIMNLIEKNQFDTIYHEHYSYYSFHTILKIFKKHGLIVYDVEQLPTHGGSLRIYASKIGSAQKKSSRVADLVSTEQKRELTNLSGYSQYRTRVEATKRALLERLICLKKEGKQIIGYGAAAKGNTFLNFCGIRTDFIDYVVDDSPYKQGQLLPGTRIPVYGPKKIKQTKPDYALILPWNLKTEIAGKLRIMRKWGGKAIVAIPSLEVIDL